MSDDAIPYIHGRDLLPIRSQRRRPDARLQRLLDDEARLRREINDLDRLVVEASGRRRRLLEQLGELIDKIRPSCVGTYGRRRRAVSHEEPLPPTAKRPRLLWGRELRAVCLAFLAKSSSAMTLRQLHALLHRAGYAIFSPYPAKALADALGHETDHGRAKRTARATYEIIDSEDTAGVATLPDW